MISFLLRRALQLIPTLIGISLVSFFLMQLAPGGPVDQMTDMNPRVTPEAQLRYDCCVPVGPDFPDPAGKAGLHLIHLAPCRYVSTQHTGPFDTLFGTFCTLLDHWIPRNNFTIMDDPAVENGAARHRFSEVDDYRVMLTICL